jgi:DNA-binding NarL/FixJ family response regulator
MANKPKILVVDDEPGVRESIQMYLEDTEEFEIFVASNGEEGLTVAQQQLPDLIISDIMMPGVDGYGLLKQLREIDSLRNTPVIFLTARGMTSDRIEGYKSGVDAYIAKPFDPEELEAVARNLLNKTIISPNEEGETTDIGQLVKEIQELKQIIVQQPTPQSPKPTIDIELTPREQSVLDLVAEGLMNKEIASRLNTSVRNVEKYVSRLFSKTDTNSRTELVRFALKYGLTN